MESRTTAEHVPVRRPAPTDTDIHPLIAGRWSPRAVSPRRVAPETLRRIFEAARWAPSSYNEQPWRFLVATVDQPGWLERLRGYLSEGNAWARESPVLVASAYRTTFSERDAENRVALRDLGAAEQNAVLEANRHGLVVHQMAGFDAERLGEELLPDGFAPGSMWVIAHPGDPEALPEEKRDAELSERSRKPLQRIVFGPEWDEGAGFLRGD